MKECSRANISRDIQANIVYNAFNADQPSQRVFVITGVRGSGKTVFMTDVSKKIAENEDFIVVELNPEHDMIKDLVSRLSSEPALAKIFQFAKINLTKVTCNVPITNIETATILYKMLESLKKNGKRVLVTIDEVTNSQEMRVFASVFQIFIRQDLPVYLIMTGLYNDISALHDEKSPVLESASIFVF